MSVFKRSEIPLLIFSFATLYILFEFFIKFPGSSTVTSTLTDYGVLLALFALLVGTLLLMRYHGTRIAKRAPGQWYHSLLTLIMFFAMFLSAPLYPSLNTYLYDNFFILLATAMGGYLGWYIYSMLYRAAKARTVEAAFLVVGVVFVLLTNAPVGEVIWGGFPIVGMWLSDVMGMGGWRGFIMGAAFGMFALAVRAIIGLEKSYMGGGE